MTWVRQGSPFVLVEHAEDGLWHVHDRKFDTCGVLFKERQDAFDYATQCARTEQDSIVLIRQHQGPLAGPCIAAKRGVMSRLFSQMWGA